MFYHVHVEVACPHDDRSEMKTSDM